MNLLHPSQLKIAFTYHTFGTSSTPPLLLHLSPCIFIASFDISCLKPHLHGRLFCNAIRRFFMRENLTRKAVTHTRQDSLAAIAFGKNCCRVSNTCDLRCRLYFCATRCNNRSRPWSLTRGRFQRLESHKTKSRSCKQQIVCNLRVAQA